MGYLGDILDPTRLAYVVVLWISFTVHEFAHARTAYALGDDTAKSMGRMTLDPLVHLDPWGSVILPLLGVPFGWAKPVPVNPTRFRREVNVPFGFMLTAAAGPLSNLALVGVFLAALGVIVRVDPVVASGIVGQFLLIGVSANVMLAVFNLLPIPPLDGSRVADWLMPDALRPAWRAIENGGTMVPFAVIIGLQYLGFDIFGPFLILARAMVTAVIQ